MNNFNVRMRVKTRTRSRRTVAVGGMSILVLSVLLLIALIRREPSAWISQGIVLPLEEQLGICRFLIPFLLGGLGFRMLFSKSWPDAPKRIALWIAVFLLSTGLLALTRNVAVSGNLGEWLYLSLKRLLTAPGSAFTMIMGLILVLFGLFRKSPLDTLELMADKIRNDIEEWEVGRKKKIIARPPIVAPRPLRLDEGITTTVPSPVQVSPPASVQTEKPSRVSPETSKKSPPPAKRKEASPSARQSVLPGTYQRPSLSLLTQPSGQDHDISQDELLFSSRLLEETLGHFNIQARVVDFHPGPVITRYDLEPEAGVRVSSIVSRSDDIALAMKTTKVRVLAPIPGKGAVGIEIPNSEIKTVHLFEILSGPSFQSLSSVLGFGLGKTTEGKSLTADLSVMPHLLVAGATGSGKSVFIHSLITSILYRALPNEVKFVLIDPKRLELPIYSGIPHLYEPGEKPENASVITQPKAAARILGKLVQVMDHRYDQFSKYNVRNIEGYNQKRIKQGLPLEFYIVVIIDELADLMLIASWEVEDTIQRLAQMARAVGIHLVLATQRPSVDVITGVIKANLPARISFRVASQTDSRVILDTAGAESLIGKGDMLYLPAGSPAPVRLQGAFVSEKDVEHVVEFVRSQGVPAYPDIFEAVIAKEAQESDTKVNKDLIQALNLIKERRRISQDLLKAHFGSSARATDLLSVLEVRGFIRKPEGTNRWEISFDKIEAFLSKHEKGVLAHES